MYYCWNCGLLQGDEDDPVVEISRLCPRCEAARKER